MTPEERTDELLSAPDSLKKSETELRKYRERKAKEEAERQRYLAGKSDEAPSVEDLIADLNRVATDQETNPFWRFKSISARRYREYGWFPMECVDSMFGQFNHAKEVAGLVDTPGVRLKKAARAIASRKEHAARYLTRRVHPYVRGPEPELREPKLMLSISDTHATFLCPFTWHSFLSAIRDLRPDIVYLNGDILEGAEISRHPKIPGWTVPLQLELDFAREMFRQIRTVFEGELIWGAGNHGLDRIAMYLVDQAPALSSLRSLKFDKLVELDDLDVQLAQGGTIASPEGTEGDQMGLLLYGFYRIHHGTKLGQTPALTELRDAQRSGQSGHIHRASVIYGTSEINQGFSWMTTPMGCTDRAARAYIKGPNTGWQSGFGVCWMYPNGKVHQYPVVTNGDRCFVEGFEYSRVPDLPDPDPQELWITDLLLP